MIVIRIGGREVRLSERRRPDCDGGLGPLAALDDWRRRD